MMGARSRAYIPHDLGNMGAIGWVMRSREIIHRPRGDNPTPKTLVWDPTPKFSILGVGRAKSRKIEAKSAWDRPEDGCHSPLPKFRSGRLEERANIRAYKTCVQAQRPEFRKSHVTTLSVAGGAL